MEEKNKKRKNPIYVIILIIALVVAAVNGVWLLSSYLEHAKAEREYESLAEAAKITTAAPPETTQAESESETEKETETEAPYVSPIDFEKLKAQNPDTVAWVTVPDTNIDYPVVYSAESNDKYLHMDFEGKDSVYGTIYLDMSDKPDFSSLHNILYGHHMKNGSMFRDIVNFKDEKFFKEHRDLYIYTPEKEFHLRTLAALYTDAGPEKRQTVFPNLEYFNDYIDRMTSKCSYREIPEEGILRLFSFVTCSYEFNNARTILYAYEVDDEGNPLPPDETLFEGRTQTVVPSSEESTTAH